MDKSKLELKRITEFSPEIHQWLEQLLIQLSETRREVDERILKKAISSPNTYLFGLFDHERLIGTGTLIVMDTFASKRGYVHDLVVDESYRGQKLGHKMMGKIIETAKELGLFDLNLSSKPQRKTQEFFESFGFQKMATNYYHMDL